jgi:hypothetical protein
MVALAHDGGFKNFKAGFARGVEFGFDAESQSDIRAADVTAAEPECNWNVNAIERTEDRGFEEPGVGAFYCAVEHFTEDDAADSVELACAPQLPDHAIDLMRTRASVFDEEELALGLRFPRGPEQCDENAEAAAVKGSANNVAGRGIFNYAEQLTP